jgi:hypothetical protein
MPAFQEASNKDTKKYCMLVTILNAKATAIGGVYSDPKLMECYTFSLHSYYSNIHLTFLELGESMPGL